jgi:uncharacterized glyoxalase superfamily metalloenzyme YdcJ
MVTVSVHRVQHWLDDHDAFQAVIDRWKMHLETLRPPPSHEPVDYLRLHFEGMIGDVERAVAGGNAFTAKTRAMEIDLYPPSDLKEEFLRRAAESIGCSVDEVRAPPPPPEIAEILRREAERK